LNAAARAPPAQPVYPERTSSRFHAGSSGVAGTLSARLHCKEISLTDHAEPSPPAGQPIDPELLELAQQVFDLARRGDAAMLAAVIEKGVPPNLRNDKGDSLVMLASYHGHADAVRTLLERGADPDLRNDNGQTPIAGAAFKGFDSVIETLLAHGANVEGASPDGRTALMIAAMFNRTAIVDLLIAHGADPQARDANGVTALDAAARMGAGDAQARLKDLGS
jgi:ankyrin repeat protein